MFRSRTTLPAADPGGGLPIGTYRRKRDTDATDRCQYERLLYDPRAGGTFKGC